MAALSNTVVIPKRPSLNLASGSSFISAYRSVGPANLAFGLKSTKRSSAQRTLTVQASYSDGGRSGSAASIFVGGFVLGGLIVGAVACVYAPQISKALTTENKKELLKKLPNFIYDEEKALEKQRKKLAEKIEQLNSAIDTVSTQLRNEKEPSFGPPVTDGYEEVYL